MHMTVCVLLSLISNISGCKCLPGRHDIGHMACLGVRSASMIQSAFKKD